jgi:hypothetical protein
MPGAQAAYGAQVRPPHRAEVGVHEVDAVAAPLPNREAEVPPHSCLAEGTVDESPHRPG